ncbi:MAG: hypothetical protein PVI33_05940 [Candidatus Omnitrophota bacterium]|jgi:myosin heavy subunit
MGDKLKIIVIALAVLLMISLFLIFITQGAKSKLEREYNLTKQRLTQENKALASRLESILAENRSLEGKLGVVQDDLERISSEKEQFQQKYELVSKEREALLAQSKSYAQFEKNLESLEKENQVLKEQIASLEKEKRTLENNLQQTKQDKASFEQKIAQAKQILKQKPSSAAVYAKEQELSVTQEAGVWSVDLPPIVVSPQITSGVESSSSLSGEILNVNTEYAFVVINLGQQMGVQEGMVFDVFRSNKFLGKIEVIQLRERIAACDIIQADVLFKTGDSVRY